MSEKIVYFVGCGPGDPELVTIKAQKMIKRADVMVYSGSLIPKEVIAMAKDDAELHDASSMVREEIFDVLCDGAIKGKTVLRLHDGDPAIYGAIREQIDELRAKNVRSIVIPGVTSFLASSAALGTQLTLPGVTQTIIITRAESRTKVPDSEDISKLARHKATMIFYLSVHLLRDIITGALEGGYKSNTPAAVVYKAGWKNEEKVITGTLADIAQKVSAARITKTAIVMIGDVLDPESYEYSRLYDKNFSHGYRKARGDASNSNRKKDSSLSTPKTGMNFAAFWSALRSKLITHYKFKTMRQSRPFEARMSDNSVHITPESRNKRNVYMKEFQGIWNIAKNDARDQRCINKGGRYTQFFNPSYVTALIDFIVEDQEMI